MKEKTKKIYLIYFIIITILTLLFLIFDVSKNASYFKVLLLLVICLGSISVLLLFADKFMLSDEIKEVQIEEEKKDAKKEYSDEEIIDMLNQKDYLNIDLKDEQKDLKKQIKRKNRGAENFELSMFAAAAISIYLVIFSFFVFLAKINGSSMESTLHDGQNIFIYTFMYTPKNNDIVVYKSADNVLIIKRVAATAGDEISIEEDLGNWFLKINGKLYKNKADEGYILNNKSVLKDFINEKGGVYKLEKDEVILLGDNAYNSYDSRNMGVLSNKDVLGRAIHNAK